MNKETEAQKVKKCSQGDKVVDLEFKGSLPSHLATLSHSDRSANSRVEDAMDLSQSDTERSMLLHAGGT